MTLITIQPESPRSSALREAREPLVWDATLTPAGSGNLKAPMLNGHGRSACLHPEFLALCGHFYLEPIAFERRERGNAGRAVVCRNRIAACLHPSPHLVRFTNPR